VKVFPVSARAGLNARLSGDPAGYEQSGLKTLEEALATFLSDEKSAVFLVAVVHKVLQIVSEEAVRGSFGEDAIQTRVRAAAENPSGAVRRDLQAAAAAANMAAGLASRGCPVCRQIEHYVR
jgi:hypothetical protein